MINAAKGLLERGHKVYLGSRTGSVVLQKAAEQNIPCLEINIHSDFSPAMTIRIMHHLRRKKIDVLICNLNKDVRVAGLAGKLTGTRLILARHGILLCSRKWRHKMTLKYLTDGIITNTDSIKSIYAQYDWFDDSFVKVLHNGIKLEQDIKSADLDKEYPGIEGRKIIFSAGRLARQKGFLYLIRSAIYAKLYSRNWLILIAGIGKQRQELQLQIRDLGLEKFVKLIGFRSNILSYMKAADVFVLPSLYEGMPNAVMEAMMIGKPVIATSVNGTPELVVDGKSGFLVQPRNPEEIFEKLDYLLKHPELCEEMGNFNVNRIKYDFSLPRMIDGLEKLFLQVLRRKYEYIIYLLREDVGWK